VNGGRWRARSQDVRVQKERLRVRAEDCAWERADFRSVFLSTILDTLDGSFVQFVGKPSGPIVAYGDTIGRTQRRGRHAARCRAEGARRFI